jgi:hypothetical protein
MCDVKVSLTFTSLSLVLLLQLVYLFCSSIVINTVIVTLRRNERGRFGALKSDSTHHFFRNASMSGTLYGFHSFPFVDWFCLFIYLWVLTFPLQDCSEFGTFVITLIYASFDFLNLEILTFKISKFLLLKSRNLYF